MFAVYHVDPKLSPRPPAWERRRVTLAGDDLTHTDAQTLRLRFQNRTGFSQIEMNRHGFAVLRTYAPPSR